MSSTFPPEPPEGGSSGSAEYLEQGGGGPLTKESASPATRKKMLVGGVAVVALAAIGGGAWAAMSFFGTGPQPAEALPDSTLGYVSIDLDPSGTQKIEAIRTLNKFPAFKEELDLETDDDLRREIFEEIQNECEDLDYEDDVEPWLGDRFAAAAVDLGKDAPAPVLVVQVSDADAADDAFNTLQSCAAGTDTSGDTGGWVIEGDWAVIAETEAIAQDVVDATDDGTLADDATYQKWNDEVGDAGILSLYASPDAGTVLAEQMDGFFFPFGAMSSSSGMGMEGDMFAEDEPMPEPEIPAELRETLEEFGGLAMTVRFSDGGLEMEVAGETGATSMGFFATDAGDDVVATLPEDTLGAVGVGFREGWLADVAEQFAASSGMSVDEMFAEIEGETGLSLPEDIETLAGESAALALGSDLDIDNLFESGDLSTFPLAAKVKGDVAGIESVLETLRESAGSDAEVIGSDSEGDYVVIGPSSDYRAEILGDGGLGDTDAFQNVIREAERATALIFVNFNAGDWLTGLAAEDEELAENLEPLQGFGMSGWQDGETSHGLLRITTD